MAKTFYKKNRRGMGRPTIFLTKNRKGLSTIVITVILIALSMAAVVLVWVFVNNMIKKQISSSQSCFENYNKVKLNPQYTCFQRISSTNYTLRFSLSVGDTQVDKVIVSVGSASAIKSYEITSTAQTISGLLMYPSNISQIVLPGTNSGLTYTATGFTSGIDSITIAPVIGGNKCEVSDSITDIEDCAIMT